MRNITLQGGSWDDDASDCRPANRDGYNPGYSYYDIGFRVALKRK